jgi:hypothetical protein
VDDSSSPKKKDGPDEPAPPEPDRDEIAGDVDARRLEDSAAGLGGATAGAAGKPGDELSGPYERHGDDR